MSALPDSFFRRLCDGLGFICIAVDDDLRITFWNHQAHRQFGGASEERIGQPFLEILREGDRERVRQYFAQTLETGTSVEAEIKHSDGGGEPSTLVMIISPIMDEDGRCIATSVGMRDISRQKRQSREWAQSRRMTSLSRMAGGVAHHFNNILGGMLTSVDYVLTSDSPRELRRTLRLLAQAIGRATRITNQLAAFAKSENESVKWMELNPIVDSFLDRIRPRARRAKITLEADVSKIASEPFESQRLMPVLESLAQNAIDAMAEDGTLSVSMTEEDDMAVISISDTGCGIPDDMQDRLFEPFFTTKGELGGGQSDNIGLGLAAVHGLVAEMGGTISLTSKVGEGTRVQVRLPVRRPGESLGS